MNTNQVLSRHGGRREGAGRKKGVPNKATAEIKALAAQYSPAAVSTLASIMRSKKSSAPARVAAAKELLDRAHGKSPQAIVGGGEDDHPVRVINEVRRIVVDPKAPS